MASPLPFSETDLREAVAKATCWAETLRLLGYAVKGGNLRTVQRWVRNWNITTEHFDPNVCRARAIRARAKPLEEVMVENSTYARGKLKERLLADGLKQRVCEMCGQGEFWNGNRMSLVLDHINGVSNDHRLENLRIVCPNCAATLATHCGRNLPRERICPRCGTRFAPTHMQHRYCSRKCIGAQNGDRLRGVPHPERRTVDRPPYARLVEEIQSMSFVALGRKYGVSDNAIRKWIRWYEAERERREAA
jgi:hypothetical protein